MNKVEGASSEQSTFQAAQPPSPPKQASKIHKISLETMKQMRLSRPEICGKSGFTILFTGDTHSNLEPSLEAFVSEKELGGAVRRIQYLEQMRQRSHQPVLVLDAGDFLQGTAYFEQFEGEPEVQVMNLAGYDVVTIGNHDFDMGWPHLEKLLKQGKFDAICSNIYLEGKPCLPPYVLLEIEGQHVAIVGIMGMDSWQSIGSSMRKGLEIKDPNQTLDEILPKIRPCVDLIILLSHSGIKEDRELARHPQVDIIIGGHSHTWMKEQELVKTAGKTTPVFHAFRNGLLVGKLDVHFENGQFTNTASSIQYLDAQFDVPQDYPSTAFIKDYQQQMEKFKTPLGECVERLPAKDKTLQLIPIGEAIANALREIAEADVGVIPAGSIKVGIEKGPFTLGALHRVLAHSEPLWVMTIKGSLLASLMQSGEERWGKARCFQYAGISAMKVAGKEIEKTASYRIAAPAFFFQREFMDQDKVLPQFAADVGSIEVRHPDLRVPFADRVRTKGLGQWVKPIVTG